MCSGDAKREGVQCVWCAVWHVCPCPFMPAASSVCHVTARCICGGVVVASMATTCIAKRYEVNMYKLEAP